jgi:hypothetical protein
MNRIIILGNGFDLANGLKTSYDHFILNYLKKSLKSARKNNVYEDNLLKIEDAYHISENLIDKTQSFQELKRFAEINGVKFSYGMLINIIFEKLHLLNWVDIENIYYSLLKNIVSSKYADEIEKLNIQFTELKNQLITYLEQENQGFKYSEKSIENYFNLFSNNFEEIKTYSDNSGAKVYNQCFIINFNYTNYLSNVVKKLNPKSYKLIYIHGEINDVQDIIFGFGDDTDKTYQQIEELNDNRFFEHIKSFNYLKNNYYQNIFSLIENVDEKFEVLIFGHSLGLSDRTMFSQIFNNPNLHKVKLYYHEKEDGTNDFRSKIHEISRHFKDKGRMRLKIVPFEESEKMIQYIP